MRKNKGHKSTVHGGDTSYYGSIQDSKDPESETHVEDIDGPPISTNVYRDPTFYLDGTLIYIQIEDILFNVHKSKLMDSKAFARWFEVQKSSEEEKERSEGLTPDNPIVMQGIAVSDLEALLKVIYAPQFADNRTSPDATLITSAFRMADLWQFPVLRDFLLSLAGRTLGDVDRIVFAKEFGLKEWLLAPHVNLCQRDRQLTLDEAKKIGIDSLLVINNLREEFPPRKLISDRERSSCSGVEKQNTHNTRNMRMYGLQVPTSYVHCDSCYTKHPWPATDTVKSTIETRIKDWIEMNT
ncbi:unnamed protein product [Rhizoctonia solani]|uniref:BTB domain-containing protein n=1 Tax=Rhizoctonia solani TaxID=456999 RepID=A0A8H2WZM2_9AGAM|nr:unnamed protein product [Rhizoctonia solani]